MATPTPAEGKPARIGARVEVIGKDIVGTVAFVGTTLFSSGKLYSLFLFYIGLIF